MNSLRNKTTNQTTGGKLNASKVRLLGLSLAFMMFSYQPALAQSATTNLMVRVAELEIDSAYLEAYRAILEEEAAASVKLEPGVITIFPMYHQEHPTQIRILEIYASKAAYEQHLKSPHFQKYETATLNMVKSLKLIDMSALDTATMPMMFRKLTEQ